jgi:hypothetical protein
MGRAAEFCPFRPSRRGNVTPDHRGGFPVIGTNRTGMVLLSVIPLRVLRMMTIS